jgi:uncharacterized membrane protein YfcA
VPPIVANATNAVALWPGSVASAVAYRKDMTSERRVMYALGAASLAGGLVGALVLLRTRNTTFVRQIPWLLLVATVFFVIGPSVAKRLRATTAGTRALALAAIAQFVIAIYGGYFGGGMSILVLGMLSMIGMTEIHAMNGLKALIGALVNGIAVLAFIVNGAVAWRPAAVMLVGGMLGGYLGARVARRIDAKRVRTFVGLIACCLTVWFFVRAYAAD